MKARGLLAAGILAAWGAGLAALAERELSRTAVDRMADAAVRVSPVATYLLVEHDGRHTGFSSFTTDTVPDGLQFTDYTVTAGPDGARQVQQVVVRASRALVLRDVQVRNGDLRASATVIDDSVLRVVRETPGGPDTTRQTFAPPLLVPSLVPMAIALGAEPSEGDTHAFDVFDPMTLRVRAMQARVHGDSTWIVVDSAAFDAQGARWRGVHADTVRAWRVSEDGSPGTGLDAWVDEQGQFVARLTEGQRARRTAYEVAFENWRTGPNTALEETSAGTAVPTPGPRLASLALLAQGIPLSRLSAAHRWQELAGDTIRLTAPVIPREGNGYWLPPHRDHRARFVRELQVEPFIEVESPVIAEFAKRLRGREPDPGVMARAFARWVADSVVSDGLPTPPSAAATLRSRAGDLAHRVHLYVALSRASGIPSRPVRGVRDTPGGLVPWTWAEAWLGGEWVPVDLASGDLPADASHVRLLIGGVGLQAELDRLLARGTLQVLARTPARNDSRR